MDWEWQSFLGILCKLYAIVAEHGGLLSDKAAVGLDTMITSLRKAQATQTVTDNCYKGVFQSTT
jgi:phosphohistidine swiveling domain-containing protein